MRYKVTHTTTYSYSDSVPVCHNEVHLTPRDLSHQTCAYNRLLIKPVPATLDRRMDYFGNHVMCFAVQEPHAKLTVTAVSKVHVAPLAPPDAGRDAGLGNSARSAAPRPIPLAASKPASFASTRPSSKWLRRTVRLRRCLAFRRADRFWKPPSI